MLLHPRAAVHLPHTVRTRWYMSLPSCSASNTTYSFLPAAEQPWHMHLFQLLLVEAMSCSWLRAAMAVQLACWLSRLVRKGE